MPIAEPAALASRLRAAPEQPQLVRFEWRYRGRDGRFSGEGGVRVSPPDSVRLDLLGPGWSGVQSAVLLGDDIHYVGRQRFELPPPTFMWSMLGVFRPPQGIEPEGARRGEWTELTYRLPGGRTIRFVFDGADRLVESELRISGDAVQEVKLKPGGPPGEPGGWAWPREARFRDLREYHEVRIKVVEVRGHEPFDAGIFRVEAR